MSRPSLHRVSAAGLAIVIGLAEVGTAGGQNFERVAPKQLPAEPAVADPTPPLPAEPTTREASAQVVPVLTGLLFVPSREAVRPEGVSAQGVSSPGLDLLATPAFTRTIAPLLGKPLTFGGLQAITQAVVRVYAAAGRPLVRAVVPEQNVASGAIQVVVLEYKVGTVVVEGNRHFSDEQVAAPFHLRQGDPVRAEEISTALDIANANPFRRVELVYRPSAQIGYTDLVLQTRDRVPLRPYVGYDNYGPRVSGRDRWSLGLNWGNAFGLDQQLSYQLTTSSDFWTHNRRDDGTRRASFVAHSLIWSIPLPWDDRLMVFGAYERVRPRIGTDFDLLGKAGQAGIRYQHRLPRVSGITQDVQIGFDFKSTNNNLDFGGLRVSRSQTEIDQLLAIYSASRPDRLGTTAATGTVVFSPGGITGANTDEDFQPTLSKPGRYGARANYLYLRGEVSRQTLLPLDATWSLRLVGQVSNRALLETEQVSVGGPDLLRGYEPNSINGDQGIVVSNELRSPDLARIPQVRFMLLGFVDYARLSDKRPVPGRAGTAEALSAGFGLRFSWMTRAIVKADYGWQLQRLPGQAERGSRGVVSIILGY